MTWLARMYGPAAPTPDAIDAGTDVYVALERLAERMTRCPLCLPPARPGVHKVVWEDRLVCGECVDQLQVSNDVLTGVGHG